MTHEIAEAMRSCDTLLELGKIYNQNSGIIMQMSSEEKQYLWRVHKGESERLARYDDKIKTCGAKGRVAQPVNH
jgi:hypothetical protein